MERQDTHPAYKPRNAGFGISSPRGGNFADGCVCIRKRIVSTKITHSKVLYISIDSRRRDKRRTRMTDQTGEYRTCRCGEEHGRVHQFHLVLRCHAKKIANLLQVKRYRKDSRACECCNKNIVYDERS